MAGDDGKISVSLASGDDGVTVADGMAAVDDWQFSTPAGSFDTATPAGSLDATAPAGSIKSLQAKSQGFVLRDKYGTIETFNADGMLIDDTDNLGNQTQYAYNGPDHPQQLATVTEQGGLVTTFTYDGDSLASVVDGYGRKTTYDNGTVTLPDPGHGEARPVWTFTYNSDYLLREIQSPNGNETDLVYDDYQRLNKVIDGVGATDPNTSDSIETTWTLQSGLSGVLANSGNGSGAATSDDLDATYTTYSGYDSSYGQGGGSTSAWVYGTDDYGYVTSLKKPATTTAGNALATAKWTWTRDSNGLPQTYVQPAGGGGSESLDELTTSYGYDDNGNLISAGYPDDSSESWEYDPIFSRMTSHTDPDGNTTTWALNSRGEATSQTENGTGSDGSSLSRETDYTYTMAPDNIDGLPGGLVLSTTLAAGTTDAVTTVTNYYQGDSADSGLASSVISAYGSAVASSVQYTYDGNGNPATRHGSGRKRDGLRLRQPGPPGDGDRPAAGAATQYRYDALGNKISETDPNGNTTKYQYDALNRLALVTLPAPGGDTVNSYQGTATTGYSYTPTGQVSDVVDALGRDTHSDYDSRGELIDVRQSAPGVAEPAAISSQAWSAAIWNANPALTSAPCTYYAYDQLGNQSQVTDPLGNVTQYGYDSMGDQTSVTQRASGLTAGAPSSLTSSTTYYADGQVASTTVPGPNDDVTTTYTYDGLGRLSGTTTIGSTGTLTDTRTYDLRDNLLSDDQVWNSNSASGLEDDQNRLTQYFYDAQDRCYETISPDPGYGEPQLETYQFFDADGNVCASLQLGVGGTAESADAARLTLNSYNALGQLTQVIQPDNLTAGAFASSDTSYAALQEAVNYEQGELTPSSDLLSLSSPVTAYTYDLDGNRMSVQQRVYDSTSMSMDTVTTSDPVRRLGPALAGHRPQHRRHGHADHLRLRRGGRADRRPPGAGALGRHGGFLSQFRGGPAGRLHLAGHNLELRRLGPGLGDGHRDAGRAARKPPAVPRRRRQSLLQHRRHGPRHRQRLRRLQPPGLDHGLGGRYVQRAVRPGLCPAHHGRHFLPVLRRRQACSR